MEAIWTPRDACQWRAAQASAGVPLQQAWAYGAALEALGARIARAEVHDGGRLLALAQFTWRRFGGVFCVALCTRGPVWLRAVTPDLKAEAYRLLRRTCPLQSPRVLIFTPEETGLPAPGLERRPRIYTGHSTGLVDLSDGAAALRARLDPKWRNQLAIAERSDLKIEPMDRSPADYRWLLDAEQAQRQAKGYRAPTVGLVPKYAAAARDGEGLLVLGAVRSGRPVAGMAFLIHGATATYQIGWSGADGRKAHAHKLILWQAFETLRRRSVHTLDMGGINSDDGPGLARFKLGAGARLVTLAGTYL